MSRASFHSSVSRLALCSAIGFLTLPSAALAQQPADKDSDGIEEVIVTATRTEAVLRKVPISVAVLTKDELDQEGARSMDDIARLTPNLQFSHESFGAGNRSFISIRGISSSVGTGTTGIYIDDTPIQIRTVRSATNTNTYPQVFDLDRIEVLKGPQGTLFGAGSEGGTVRFITEAPSLDTFGGYGRAEISSTESGALSSEIGLAMGGPIVEDRIGFRASGWYRRDGGFVDRVDPTTGTVLNKNTNGSDSFSGRLAVTLKPVENLTITPSVFYQNVSSDDTSAYWTALSDPDSNRLRSGYALGSPANDRFLLSAVSAQLDLDGIEVVSNTSFFDRKMLSHPNYSEYVSQLLTGQPYLLDPSFTFGADYPSTQNIFTQEVRVQSADPDAALTWVAGVFYSHGRQRDVEAIDGDNLDAMLIALTGHGVTDIFGQPLYKGYSFYDDQSSRDTQTAVFAQADYRIVDGLKATVGLRFSDTRFDFHDTAAGPYNGPEVQTSGSQHETPLTPRFGLSWQLDDNNLLYSNVAKGFRAGGAQGAIAAASCAGDLAALGLTHAPTEYGSDSLWSYEVGAKNRLFDGKLLLDTSAFHVDWKDIQGRISLPTCGLGFIGNLGAATSEGVDFSAAAHFDNLSLEGSLGYTHATYSKTLAIGGLVMVEKGERLVPSQWSATASAQYDVPFGEQTGYGRIDYQFRGDGATLPTAVSDYDPALGPIPAINVVSLRVGVLRDGLNLSAFVYNVFDAHPDFKTRDFVGSPLFYAVPALRPRTVGLTLTGSF